MHLELLIMSFHGYGILIMAVPVLMMLSWCIWVNISHQSTKIYYTNTKKITMKPCAYIVDILPLQIAMQCVYWCHITAVFPKLLPEYDCIRQLSQDRCKSHYSLLIVQVYCILYQVPRRASRKIRSLIIVLQAEGFLKICEYKCIGKCTYIHMHLKARAGS